MSTTTSTGPVAGPSQPAPAQAPKHRMPFGRWFAEIGWRHVVGLLAIAFAVFPILFVISASVNPSGSLSATGLIPTQGVTFEHYAAMLSGERANFLRWYLNTIIVCGVVAVVQVFLSLLAAYAFSRFRFRGRRGGMLAVLLIMMFPAILSMIAVYTMIAGLGEVVPMLGLNTLAGYIAVLLGGALGQVWLIKGFFDTIPKSLDEAALIDGASHWQTFTRILVPSMTPILATTLLLALVGAMSEFLIGSIFLTDDSKKTLAVGMYGMFSSDRSNNLGVFAAGSVMVMLPVIILYQFLQRYIVGGSTAGAVKG
ncbi:arabinogalactan oligomer/maltooligosaccharide transport system permease protein [Brachybacterium aquaticum]|uniref:Arabinogalactan oligomer/maltooligosaccharide transport system permease protein n=2 Tax=Brachybacterium aquaticum TaxID=1432564 RepID=A0A841AEW1_9MICO|nr:ABC transporter permease subunit [Brachybacterium aquaticum]MBB5831812.1 arabinogalactan oligomer/maltooligosaccharide transport system permease protein [Brachybacterium aquaticum]